MANILDYLLWRGDLRFDERPFGDVDSLILSELCYLDFSGILPSDFTGAPVTVREAAAHYLALHKPTDMGVLVPSTIPALLQQMARTERFSDVLLCGYESMLDTRIESQFAALCALSSDLLYVAFRGTDDTIVGWKEDFNMAFMQAVPAQELSVQYLVRAAQAFPARPIHVGGHSKGGNLAVYAAVCCGERVQNQIAAVYNYDGPGLHKNLLSSECHQRIAGKIRTFVPESSVVGMLLEHEECYTVVRSAKTGLFQHDGFSWQIRRDQFEVLPGLDEAGLFTSRTMHAFLQSLSNEQRMHFVDALYEILTCTDAQTLTELKNGGRKTASAMLRTMRTFDKPTRHAIFQTLQALLKSGVRAAGDEHQKKRRTRVSEPAPEASAKNTPQAKGDANSC